MSPSSSAIVWFREDLRLSDNPALHAACRTGQPIVLLYIFDDTSPDLRELGGASKWWLHSSLKALAKACEKRGAALVFRKGKAETVLQNVIDETQATSIYWNRRYDAAGIAVDAEIKSRLTAQEVRAVSFNGRLLTEPWEIKTGGQQPYRVFSPYWKALRASYQPPAPLPAPGCLQGPSVSSERLEDWKLLPANPNWAREFDTLWTPGETGAKARLGQFLSTVGSSYKENRDRPDIDHTSRLSPHLRFGEISPHQVWRSVNAAQHANAIPAEDAMKFLSELAWREFAHVLLFSQPHLATQNYKSDFDAMPWSDDKSHYDFWCRGLTGYPIVDAGMRELWATGWMHNRVRMITASFLTKHLMISWQWGEHWFWDTLVDADHANNPASWQWVAGSGADAAPYFRIFNPMTQGRKFDPDGAYVRKWCPELKNLPTAYIHAPWEATPETRAIAGVTLGETYPTPIIDHATARQRALDAYKSLKESKETV